MSIIPKKNKNLVYPGLTWFFIFFMLPLAIILVYSITERSFIDLKSVELDQNSYKLTTKTGRCFILAKTENKQKVGTNGYSRSFPSSKDTRSSVAGKKPIFFIRPEKIKISGETREKGNNFKGTIRSVVFEGPDIRLEVQSPDTGRIRIEIKNDGTLTDYIVGKDIGFSWNTDTGILIEN